MLGGSSSSSAPLAPDVSAEADGHPSMLGLLAAQDSVSEVNPVSRAPGAAVLTRAQAISVHVPEHLLSRPAKRKKGTDVPDAVGDEPRAFPERAGAHFREPASLAALRYRRFDEAWSRTESRIKAAVAKTHAATLARIASFLATEAPATPNPALPTLLITVRSPAPSSYLPPVLDAINGVAVTATLLPKDAKDLKSALASVSRALATSSSKFLKLDSAEEEDEDDNVYFRVKKAKGAAKIPEFDPAWIVAWWRTLSTECGKREVSSEPPRLGFISRKSRLTPLQLLHPQSCCPHSPLTRQAH